MSSATASAPAQRARGHPLVVLIAIVATVALIGVLVLIPLPHPFVEVLHSGGTTAGAATYSFPSGSSVTGKWATASGDDVGFDIRSGSGNVIYSATASSGSFGFTASDPPYTFTTLSTGSETTNVTGTFDASYL
jgi:hypothetical protein